MYKNVARLYQSFLIENENQIERQVINRSPDHHGVNSVTEDNIGQKLSLERDMQEALRRNILSLDPNLQIIDDGIERSVDTGFIDITCEDNDGLVVIELKAGKADARAVGQILGYMGDLQDTIAGKPVRGILVAHDFDARVKSAARAVKTLTLKKYSVEFKFTNS